MVIILATTIVQFFAPMVLKLPPFPPPKYSNLEPPRGLDIPPMFAAHSSDFAADSEYDFTSGS